MILERSTEKKINIYYDLYLPEPRNSHSLPLLIALHGYEGNKESMMALARRINSRDFLIASVQAPNAFIARDLAAAGAEPKIGFGWMMQYRAEETIRLHHETVRSVVEDASREYEIDRSAIFLLGFSQSVSLNYRFAFTNPGTVRGVIAVCGGIPGDWSDEKYHKSETDILVIAGEKDEFYPLERTRTFKDALSLRAAAVDFMSFPVQHVFPRESLPMINEWLLARVHA